MQNIKDNFKTYLQPAFLICVMVLAGAGSGMSIAIKYFGVYLKKEPLPLKKSLNLLDETALAPYKVISKDKIDNEEIIKSLGTEYYLQWNLEDTETVADSPVRNCQLFVTYYELPDVVPHVPEECYTGSGYQRLSSDSVTFKLNKEGLAAEIPGRYVVFASSDSGYRQLTASLQFPVLYFFNVNNEYVNSRTAARMALNKNIRSKHSYFSKVEWKFFSVRYGVQIYPSREEAIAASAKLLNMLLPVLEKEHWPDMKSVVNN
jgi:hypothetical protein